MSKHHISQFSDMETIPELSRLLLGVSLRRPLHERVRITHGGESALDVRSSLKRHRRINAHSRAELRADTSQRAHRIRDSWLSGSNGTF